VPSDNQYIVVSFREVSSDLFPLAKIGTLLQMAPAGRGKFWTFGATGDLMSKPELTASPKLTAGVRLSDKNQQPRMLLLPGRELRLSGPSLEIVMMCDGKHTVAQIAEKLQTLYAKAEPQRVEQDLLSYLDLLHEQKAIEY